MFNHDADLAEENHDWEEVTADERLTRLNGFLLNKKRCQCEDCLWEYRLCTRRLWYGRPSSLDFSASPRVRRGNPAARESIPALQLGLLDEDGPPADENSVAGIAAWALDQIRGGPGSDAAPSSFIY
jgi:hypothetical protein